MVLDDNELLEYIKRDVAKPMELDAHNLAKWKKDVSKVRRIILERVRDLIVSNLHGKETHFAMWTTLTEIFENNSDDRKLALKDKLRNIKMQKNGTILWYLTIFTQVRDELGGVGVKIAEDDLVNLALLGLPKSLHNYHDSVNGREKLLDWEWLWFDLVQGEINKNTRDGTSSKGKDEENFSLVGKGKGKKS